MIESLVLDSVLGDQGISHQHLHVSVIQMEFEGKNWTRDAK